MTEAFTMRLVGDQPASKPVGKWMTVEKAASISGMSKGQISRLCKDSWQHEGKARKVKLESAQMGWEVAETADPKFAAIQFPEQMSAITDMANWTQVQRDLVMLREQIVKAWLADREAGLRLGLNVTAITDRFVDTCQVRFGDKVSARNLYNWHNAWRISGRAGLLDKRSEQTHELDHTDFREYFMKMYLNPNKRKVTVCYDHARVKAEEMGWTFPQSDRTCRRWVAQLDPKVVTKLRDGEKAFVDKHEAYITRDYSTIDSNEIWCGDHHNFDVIVRIGTDSTGKPIHGRPWITGWQDVRSRKLVGYTIQASAGNTETIIQAFYQAAVDHGLPKVVYVDNGKDYDAKALQGETKAQRRTRKRTGVEIDNKRINSVFGIASIDVWHAWPYHGQSKPIERLFGTICERFSKLFDTYCGRNPQEKPEGLQGRIDNGMAVTLEEFKTTFATWLESDYHTRVHLGDSMHGKTPNQVFAECLHKKRTVKNGMLLFMCMPAVGPVTVHQGGVTWQGIPYGQFSPQLQNMLDKKVLLRIDHNDRSRVLVTTADGDKFICEAKSNSPMPWKADSALVREAISEKRKMRKADRDYHARRPRVAADMQETLGMLAAEKAKSNKPSQIDPPSLQPHRTAFDGQADEIRRAVEGGSRIAAGGENIDPEQKLPVLGPICIRTLTHGG